MHNRFAVLNLNHFDQHHFGIRHFLQQLVKPLILVVLCWQASAHAQTHDTQQNLSQVNAQDWLYSVKLNESYARIQQQYLTKHSDIAVIAKLNNHPIEQKLQPNQVLRIPLKLLKKQAKPVEVILVVGEVFVTGTEKSVAKKSVRKQALKDTSKPESLKQPLLVNSQLKQGDMIQTGANSIAKLRFADASTTIIQPNANVQIQQSFQYAGQGDLVTQLKLNEGRTEVLANPNRNTNSRFQIETPSAVAAVRGTSFRVGAEGDLALQETLAGEVAFIASGEEVLLSQGFGSAAETGKAPLPPIVLPDAPNVSQFPNVVDGLPVTFTLQPQPDTVAWVSQLALDSDITRIVAEQTVPVSTSNQGAILDFTDLADGQYYLKLRAKEVNGLQGKDAVHSFKVAARPLPPSLITPENNAKIGDLPLDFSWSLVQGGNSYLVQIAEDAEFTQIVAARVTSFGQLQLNPVLLKQSTIADSATKPYYWRVSSLVNGKPLKFSKVRVLLR